MNTSYYNRRFQKKNQELNRVKTQKFIVFSLGQESYAIEIEKVQRILKEFTPQGILESGRQLIRDQNQTITIIDLSTLFVSYIEKQPQNYLIICKLPDSNSIGIPIPEMPTILEISPDQFDQVPELYRQGNLSPAIEKLIHTAEGQVIFYLSLEKLIHTEC
jgi:chemotaxis signal transduction protein